MVKEIASEADFYAVLEDGARVGVVTVVDVYAPWCGPCQRFKPTFEQFARVFPDVRFVSLDGDRLDRLAFSLAVSAFPSFLVYAGGKVFQRLRGANGPALQLAIDGAVAKLEEDLLAEAVRLSAADEATAPAPAPAAASAPAASAPAAAPVAAPVPATTPVAAPAPAASPAPAPASSAPAPEDDEDAELREAMRLSMMEGGGDGGSRTNSGGR